MNERKCLAFDPFAGDETDVRVLSDKFVTTRTKHKCQNCAEKIPPGKRVRARAEVNKEEGKRGTFYWCELCCAAMASSWDDDGDAYEERSVTWQRLKARMEAGA